MPKTTLLFLALAFFYSTAFYSTAQAQAPNAWINELHYDNTGGDQGEFVEVVLPSSFTSLDRLRVLFYNGTDGSTYDQQDLDQFTAGETQGGFTVYADSVAGIQNGAPDGLALCYDSDGDGTYETLVSSGGVDQFLSYEGTLTATEGCANGQTSTDIVVEEGSSTPVGESLQLEGSGTSYADFNWVGPRTDSPEMVNTNQTLGGTAAPTVQFTSASATVDEGAGTATLTVSISNPDGNQVSVDVVFVPSQSTASASDIGNYSTQTVTFPASASDGDTRTVTVNITDDSNNEGTEIAQFALQNLTTSGSATIGTPDEFDLSITDNDGAALVINEILADPPSASACQGFGKPDDCGDANNDGTVSSTQDEFVEILNTGTTTIDIGGYVIADDNSDRYTFPSGTMLDAGEAATIFGGGTPTGIPGFDDTAGSLGLNNTGDTVFLKDPGGNVIASYTYGSEGGNDQSLARDPDGTGPFVQHSTIDRDNDSSPDGDLFSPGEQNAGLQPLPVELTSFEAAVDGRAALLTWTTASETNNAGFEVELRRAGSTAFEQIGFQEGAGTTTEAQRYTFRTDDLPAGRHAFRLRQVDFDGQFAYSATVEVEVAARFALSEAYPNPFRSRAQLTLSVAAPQTVTVALYDVLGRRVRTLHHGLVEAGPRSTFVIDGAGLPSGVYFCRIQGETFSETRRVVLAK